MNGGFLKNAGAKERVKITGAIKDSGLHGKIHQRLGTTSIRDNVVESDFAFVENMFNDIGGNACVVFLDFGAAAVVFREIFIAGKKKPEVLAHQVSMLLQKGLPDDQDAAHVPRQKIL